MDPVYEVEQMAGFDWRAALSKLAPAATARGLALALAPIAGGSPTVADYSGYSEISFSPDQEERISQWILMQLRKEPGSVRVDSGGIALKVVTRQYGLWFAGAVAAGAVLGYTLRKRGR
jgi:hypothetical protein